MFCSAGTLVIGSIDWCFLFWFVLFEFVGHTAEQLSQRSVLLIVSAVGTVLFGLGVPELVQELFFTLPYSRKHETEADYIGYAKTMSPLPLFQEDIKLTQLSISMILVVLSLYGDSCLVGLKFWPFY